MLDESCVLELTGSQIVAALENGFCMYPKLEGRFPQLSGVKVTFDASLPPGGRVRSVTGPNGEPLELERTYKVLTKEYLSHGACVLFSVFV